MHTLTFFYTVQSQYRNASSLPSDMGIAKQVRSLSEILQQVCFLRFLSSSFGLLTNHSCRHFTDAQKRDKLVKVVGQANSDGVHNKRNTNGPAPVSTQSSRKLLPPTRPDVSTRFTPLSPCLRQSSPPLFPSPTPWPPKQQKRTSTTSCSPDTALPPRPLATNLKMVAQSYD